MSFFQYINRTLNSSRSLILFAMFAGYFFLRTTLLPLAHDDFSYAFIWDGAHGGNLAMMQTGSPEIEYRERVSSFSDIFESQWSHYFTWGGRVFAHTLIQFFLWIGKPYFNVANTIVFILLILVIINLANTWLKISRKALIWIFLSLNLFAAWSINTMFWLTGSCNYMWMSFVQLFFLTPYVKALRSNDAGDSKLNVVIMIVLGILAGWSNEVGALVTIFLATIMVIMCRAQGVFRTWMVAGLAVAIISCCFMILAPGNFERLSIARPDYHYSLDILCSYLTGSFPRIIAADLITLIPMFIYFGQREPGKLNTNEILMLLFSIGGFLVPTIMLFAPEFNLRMSMPSMAFTLVASTSAILQLERSDFKLSMLIPESFLRGVSVTLTSLLVFYFATLIYVDISVFNSSRRQVRYMQRHADLETIELTPLYVRHRFDCIQGDRTAVPYMHYLGGLTEDKNFYINLFVARYYGVKSVVGVPE
ncbi:MAG: DUF6056 family protein [Selenomonadaceae bacterium]|nr:DUF6056 family protein [Selenomonadaceae bacterium]